MAADAVNVNPAEAFNHALTALESYADHVRDFRATAPELVEKSSSGLVINPPLSTTLKTIAQDFRAWVNLSDAERAERLSRWRP